MRPLLYQGMDRFLPRQQVQKWQGSPQQDQNITDFPLLEVFSHYQSRS